MESPYDCATNTSATAVSDNRSLKRSSKNGGITFPLVDVPAPFERLEHPDRLGKIIIEIAAASK